MQRKSREREKLLRQSMLDSTLSFSNRKYNDDLQPPSLAESSSLLRRTVYEEEGEEEEDSELEEFEAQDSLERLQAILDYLRTKHYYCFWCGCQYNDADDLANCPGLTELEHE